MYAYGRAVVKTEDYSLQHACPLGHFDGHLQCSNGDVAPVTLGHLLL